MAQPFIKPVRDSVPKVSGDVAVGEDLKFQRRWWRFEGTLWTFFLIILIADLLGAFGHGWLAKGRRSTADQALTLDYERIERANTPSVMTLHFAPTAVHDGRVQLFVSQNVVHTLGAARITPQPQVSALTQGGTSYTFPATPASTTVEIALQPSLPGLQHVAVQIPGSDPIRATIFILP